MLKISIIYPHEVESKKYLNQMGFYDLTKIAFPVKFTRGVSERVFIVVFKGTDDVIIVPLGGHPTVGGGFLYSKAREISDTLEKEIDPKNMDSMVNLFNIPYFAKFADDAKSVRIYTASSFCYCITPDNEAHELICLDSNNQLFRFTADKEDYFQLVALNFAAFYLSPCVADNTSMNEDAKLALLYLCRDNYGTDKKMPIADYRRNKLIEVMRTSKDEFKGLPDEVTKKLSKIVANVVKEEIEKEDDKEEDVDNYNGISFIPLVDFFLAEDSLDELSSHGQLKLHFTLDDAELCNKYQEVYYNKNGLFIRPAKGVELDPKQICAAFGVIKFNLLEYLPDGLPNRYDYTQPEINGLDVIEQVNQEDDEDYLNWKGMMM